ncbi:hypothetical protein PG997_014010 [Apiospora hydei]|uniref:Uncharacterized protein n=1 Tax=Apiospora hydei TaxID=1337664 RepID=A0ABR1VBG8_9PEZI
MVEPLRVMQYPSPPAVLISSLLLGSRGCLDLSLQCPGFDAQHRVHIAAQIGHDLAHVADAGTRVIFHRDREVDLELLRHANVAQQAQKLGRYLHLVPLLRIVLARSLGDGLLQDAVCVLGRQGLGAPDAIAVDQGALTQLGEDLEALGEGQESGGGGRVVVYEDDALDAVEVEELAHLRQLASDLGFQHGEASVLEEGLLAQAAQETTGGVDGEPVDGDVPLGVRLVIGTVVLRDAAVLVVDDHGAEVDYMASIGLNLAFVAFGEEDVAFRGWGKGLEDIQQDFLREGEKARHVALGACDGFNGGLTEICNTCTTRSWPPSLGWATKPARESGRSRCSRIGAPNLSYLHTFAKADLTTDEEWGIKRRAELRAPQEDFSSSRIELHAYLWVANPPQVYPGREAYRGSLRPAVPWQYLQRQFGITSNSDNLMTSTIVGLDAHGQLQYVFNEGMPEVVVNTRLESMVSTHDTRHLTNAVNFGQIRRITLIHVYIANYNSVFM